MIYLTEAEKTLVILYSSLSQLNDCGDAGSMVEGEVETCASYFEMAGIKLVHGKGGFVAVERKHELPK